MVFYWATAPGLRAAHRHRDKRLLAFMCDICSRWFGGAWAESRIQRVTVAGSSTDGNGMPGGEAGMHVTCFKIVRYLLDLSDRGLLLLSIP
jgi:hypothetical protein